MKYLKEQQNDYKTLSDLVKALEANEITDFFIDDNNIIGETYIAEAVLLFTYALNTLDMIPDNQAREKHVLMGDYYFSEFYFTLSQGGHMDIVYDMVTISKDLASKKSDIYANTRMIDEHELKYLLFAPLFYLIDNGYVSSTLYQVIDKYYKSLDKTALTYITNIKGED